MKPNLHKPRARRNPKVGLAGDELISESPRSNGKGAGLPLAIRKPARTKPRGAGRRPEVQGIALATAGETAVGLPIKMHGEGAGRGRAAAGNRAWAAKLRTTPPGRREADQVQDLPHPDLPPKLVVVDAWHGSYAASALAAAGGFLARWARYDLPRIFRRMAPSTIRSRKAIAKGGSPR
jgi:hypothetical protein